MTDASASTPVQCQRLPDGGGVDDDVGRWRYRVAAVPRHEVGIGRRAVADEPGEFRAPPGIPVDDGDRCGTGQRGLHGDRPGRAAGTEQHDPPAGRVDHGAQRGEEALAIGVLPTASPSRGRGHLTGAVPGVQSVVPVRRLDHHDGRVLRGRHGEAAGEQADEASWLAHRSASSNPASLLTRSSCRRKLSETLFGRAEHHLSPPVVPRSKEVRSTVPGTGRRGRFYG